MLAWVEEDGVPLLVWQGPPGIVAAFSGRLGGVSEAPYASLNVGMRSGDDRDSRAGEPRTPAAARSAPIPRARRPACRCTRRPCTARLPVPQGGDFLSGTAEPPHGDALHTDEAGRAVVAFAADCVPIVLARADGSAVGVCHAGWKGLAGGVVEATAAALGARAAGRGGRTVRRAGALRGRARTWPIRYASASATTSFARAAPTCRSAPERALRACRRAAIDVAGLCTISDAERFFSHRRDGAPGGRQAVIAYREAA